MNTSKWKQEIDQVTTEFEKKFINLPIEIIFKKPDNKTWCIAENMLHLIKINESYYPILDGLIDGTYKPAWPAKIGFLVRFFGKSILRSVQPDRSRKMKTFTLWEPVMTINDPDIFKKFRAHQETLKNRIDASAPFLDEGAVIHSPANKYLVYTLETAFDIIVTHEKRHFEQCAETYEIIKSKS